MNAGEAPPVSVIICAKDEAANLVQHLPAVLQQQYSAPYEVIVVNDHSQDNTEQILLSLAQQYPHLRYINMPAGTGGKKNALIAGTHAAIYNIFLFTDADCTPISYEWLQLMAAPFTHGKEVVACLGAYTNNGSLLQTFIAWETLHTFMQYAGYAGNGLPYMATGRNMACTRTAMHKAIQHPLWQQLSSGHDDVIVQAAGTSANTAIVGNRAAYTVSPAKTSWKAWAAQKQRHVSTGKHYHPRTKFLLGLYACTHAAVWILFFSFLFLKNAALVIVLFAARLILLSTAWSIAASYMGRRLKGLVWLLGDFIWMIYNFAFLPYITWKNKTSWK